MPSHATRPLVPAEQVPRLVQRARRRRARRGALQEGAQRAPRGRRRRLGGGVARAGAGAGDERRRRVFGVANRSGRRREDGGDHLLSPGRGRRHERDCHERRARQRLGVFRAHLGCLAGHRQALRRAPRVRGPGAGPLAFRRPESHPTVPDARDRAEPRIPERVRHRGETAVRHARVRPRRRALAERRRDAGAEQRGAPRRRGRRGRAVDPTPRPEQRRRRRGRRRRRRAPGGGGRVGRVARARALGVRRDRAHQRLDHASPVGAIAGRGEVARGGGERVKRRRGRRRHGGRLRVRFPKPHPLDARGDGAREARLGATQRQAERLPSRRQRRRGVHGGAGDVEAALARGARGGGGERLRERRRGRSRLHTRVLQEVPEVAPRRQRRGGDGRRCDRGEGKRVPACGLTELGEAYQPRRERRRGAGGAKRVGHRRVVQRARRCRQSPQRRRGGERGVGVCDGGIVRDAGRERGDERRARARRARGRDDAKERVERSARDARRRGGGRRDDGGDRVRRLRRAQHGRHLGAHRTAPGGRALGPHALRGSRGENLQRARARGVLALVSPALAAPRPPLGRLLELVRVEPAPHLAQARERSARVPPRTHPRGRVRGGE